MGQPAVKKPKGGGDGLVPTIREFLPWHVIERKLKERAAANPDAEELPDSGVYTSGEHPSSDGPVNDAVASEILGDASAPDGGNGLSYKVYTVAELEARGIQSDLSVNSTRGSIALLAQRVTPWTDVARAALDVVRLAKTWAFSASPRPPMKDLLQPQIDTFRFELQIALRQTEWKKVALGTGIGLTALLVLLFAVLTAADLTDDLKPSRVVRTQSGDSYTQAIVAAAHPTAKPKPVVQRAAPAPAADDVIEVSSDFSEPAPKASAKSRAKKKKAPAGPPSEIFIP